MPIVPPHIMPYVHHHRSTESKEPETKKSRSKKSSSTKEKFDNGALPYDAYSTIDASGLAWEVEVDRQIRKKQEERERREWQKLMESEVPIKRYVRYLPPFSQKIESDLGPLPWLDSFEPMEFETEPFENDPIPALLKKKHKSKTIDGKTYYLIVDPTTKEETWCYYEPARVLSGYSEHKSSAATSWLPRFDWNGIDHDKTVFLGGKMAGSTLYPVTTDEESYRRGWACVLRKAKIQGKKVELDHEHYVIYDLVSRRSYTYKEEEVAHIYLPAPGLDAKDLHGDKQVSCFYVSQGETRHKVNLSTQEDESFNMPKWEQNGVQAIIKKSKEEKVVKTTEAKEEEKEYSFGLISKLVEKDGKHPLNDEKLKELESQAKSKIIDDTQVFVYSDKQQKKERYFVYVTPLLEDEVPSSRRQKARVGFYINSRYSDDVAMTKDSYVNSDIVIMQELIKEKNGKFTLNKRKYYITSPEMGKMLEFDALMPATISEDGKTICCREDFYRVTYSLEDGKEISRERVYGLGN